MIDFYIKRLAGSAYSRKHKQNIPVYEVYKDVMAILNVDGDQAKKYREKIIGKTALETAPREYWDTLMITEMNTSILEWKSRPIHERAMIIAARTLKGMIEVIDAHYKEQDDAMERLQKGGGKGG